ncbi:MAG: DUF5131 family protein [Mesorhizobium sp.]|nr:MAG: DUF5131 family protein [Mesorhizobium sp.]
MGAVTGIKWTDSTWNSWWGCTKVGPACDHCYAEGVDKRTGENHWGSGAPRRLLSAHSRYEPYRWQKGAAKFEAEHGRRRRVFTLSMGDLFDNEVPGHWRLDHMRTMESCDRLDWQICTKRIGNARDMVPWPWLHQWPRHIGVLVTIVTQKEADRDLPKLLDLKGNSFIPWVGVSYEPAQEAVDFTRFLDGPDKLDWIIFGGKSGPQWNDRPFSVEWGAAVAEQCAWTNTAFFFKQVAAARPTDAMIPPHLFIRQFPVWQR